MQALELDYLGKHRFHRSHGSKSFFGGLIHAAERESPGEGPILYVPNCKALPNASRLMMLGHFRSAAADYR
jgi:hypothetical protein